MTLARHVTFAVLILLSSSAFAQEWWTLPRPDRIERAVRALRGREAAKRLDADTQFLLGRCLFLCANDYAGAERALKDAASRLLSAPAWAVLGELYYVQARMRDAHECFLLAIDADPTHPVCSLAVRRVRGLAGRIPGYDERTLPVFARTFERLGPLCFPTWNNARSSLDLIHLRRGACDKADAFRRAGGYPTVWFWVGPFGKSAMLSFDLPFRPESATGRPAEYATPRGPARWMRSVFGRETVRPRGARHGGTYYAKTYLHSDRAGRALLRLSSSASAKLFLNRQQVLVSDRRTVWGRTVHLLGATVRPGWNEVLIKVSRQTTPPSLAFQALPYPGEPAVIRFLAGGEHEPPQVSGRSRLRASDVISTGDEWAKSLRSEDLANPLVAALRAEQQVALGDVQRAKAVITAAAEAYQKSAYAHYRRGWISALDGSIGAATRAARTRLSFATAVGLCDDLSVAHYALGMAEQREGKVQEAVARLSAQAGASPQWSGWAEGLSECYRRHGWTAEALEALRAASETAGSPRPYQRPLKYVRDMDRTGLYRTVSAALAKTFPTSAYVPDSAIHMRRYDEAEAGYVGLLAQAPDRPEVLRAAARAARARGSFDAAVSRLRRAAHVSRVATTPLIELADTFMLAGDPTPAGRALDLSLEADAPSIASFARRRFSRHADPTSKHAVRLKTLFQDRARHDLPHRGVSAARLLRQLVILVNADGSSFQRHHIVTRLYDKNGIRRFSELTIPKGAYLLELRTIKSDRRRTFEPERHAGKDSISMPALAPGDYIEVEYVSLVPANPHGLGSYLSPTFYFEEQGVSNEHVELVGLLPPGADVRIRSRAGAPNVRRSFRDGYRVLRWERRHALGRGREALSAPPDDVLANARFSANLTWRDVSRSFLSAAMDETRLTPEIRQYASNACDPRASAVEKARALYTAVCRDVSAISAKPLHVSRDASIALAEKRLGRAQLLAALLSAVGVKSQFCLVSSLRSASLDAGFPEWDGRSWASIVLRVCPPDGHPVWLHPMARFAPFGYLPPHMQDRPALAIGPEVESPSLFTDVLPPAGEVTLVSTTLDLTTGDEPALTSTIAFRGDLAMRARRVCAAASPYVLKQHAQALASAWSEGSTVLAVSADDPLALRDPFVVRVNGRAGLFVKRVGGGYGLRVPVAPLRLVKRLCRYPKIAFPLLIGSPVSFHDRTEVRLPRGRWTVDGQAATRVKLDRAFGTYVLEVRVAGAVLHVRRRVDIPCQRLDPEIYPKLMSFCLRVDEAERSTLKILPTGGPGSG